MKSSTIVAFLLGVALTAAVIAVVLGTDFLPSLIAGGPTPTASPTPTVVVDPSLTPSPSPSPSPSASPSPSPSPSGTPVPTPGGIYIVEPGDTLIRIGTRLGVPWLLIAEANELEEPYRLNIGDELVIPPPPEGGIFYTVVAGDTLGDIAYQFRVNLDDILVANGLTDPDTINIGQVLIIPGAAPSPSP